jgi:hypothetical protein
MTNDELQLQLDETKLKYKKLRDKIVEVLDCQQAYFKSRKDFQLLKKSKTLETELREMINPKPKPQGSLPFEFLAQ